MTDRSSGSPRFPPQIITLYKMIRGPQNAYKRYFQPIPQKWSTIEKECWALVKAFNTFESLLLGKEFKVSFIYAQKQLTNYVTHLNDENQPCNTNHYKTKSETSGSVTCNACLLAVLLFLLRNVEELRGASLNVANPSNWDSP